MPQKLTSLQLQLKSQSEAYCLFGVWMVDGGAACLTWHWQPAVPSDSSHIKTATETEIKPNHFGKYEIDPTI